MNLIFRIPANSIVRTYKRIGTALKGSDALIFEAMSSVTANERNQFDAPTDSSNYGEKHREIERRFETGRMLGGLPLAVQLLEKIYSLIEERGGVPGVSDDTFFQSLYFDAEQDVTIRYTREKRWAAEWKIQFTGNSEPSFIHIVLYSSQLGEIVPEYVVQYICSGIYAHRHALNPAAVALLSIAVEATLRDRLAPLGYSFTKGGSPVDVFNYTNANVRVSGNAYVLTMVDPTPKLPGDFSASTNGVNEIPIQIRRQIHPKKGRVDLSILTQPELIDHLSSDLVVTPADVAAQKNVGGLGQALNIARNNESLLTPVDLPLDLDEVLQAVRNNLIHLSGDSLSNHLPSLGMTLGDFLQENEIVYDFMLTVPRFINEQYVKHRTGNT